MKQPSSELVLRESQTLQILAGVRNQLAQCKSVDEAKNLHDRAHAVQEYSKRQDMSYEVQADAGEIRLLAEHRLGELLRDTVRHQGGRPSKNGSEAEPFRLPKGMKKKQSHRFQQVALLPKKRLLAHIAETRAARGDITTASALRLAKQQYREAKLATFPTESVADLEALVKAGKRFGTIYADPPWKYGNQATRSSTDNHYPTMTLDAIAALPIPALVADVAHLHLWTTNAFLFACPRILEAWGFEYKSVFVWAKPQMGIGNYWRVSHEFLVLGVRGSCPFADKSLMSWKCIPRGSHSTKPEEVRRMIETASPGPRLELFGRRLAEEWTVWGNERETTMFDDDETERKLA